MSKQENELRTQQPNPYESPKQPAKQWRFSVLTTAAICVVVLSAVSAGAFMTNQAISKSRKTPFSFPHVSPLTRGPVPRQVIEPSSTAAQPQASAVTVGQVAEVPPAPSAE